MKVEEILSMQPGREMDLLVAEKVMNWEFGEDFIELNGGLNRGGKWFNPSVDIAAAWEVVEKMRLTHVYELADFGRNTYKQFQHFTAFHPVNEPRDSNRQVRAKTLTEAICKSALLAVMNE